MQQPATLKVLLIYFFVNYIWQVSIWLAKHVNIIQIYSMCSPYFLYISILNYCILLARSWSYICLVLFLSIHVLFGCRTAASFLRASESSSFVSNSELGTDCKQLEYISTSEVEQKDNFQVSQRERQDFQFPFPWSKPVRKHQNLPEKRCHPNCIVDTILWR